MEISKSKNRKIEKSKKRRREEEKKRRREKTLLRDVAMALGRPRRKRKAAAAATRSPPVERKKKGKRPQVKIEEVTNDKADVLKVKPKGGTLFDSWLKHADEKLLSSIDESSVEVALESLAKVSAPIIRLANGKAETLPRFELFSAVERGTEEEEEEKRKRRSEEVKSKPKRRGPRERPPMSDCYLDDAVVFTGGPNWSLAWCPEVQKLKENTGDGAGVANAYCAVGPHSASSHINVVNDCHDGPGIIEILQIRCGAERGKIADAKLCCTIRHQGAVTWDLAWCPQHFSADVGILAAALGNGEVCIYCFPFPSPEETGGGGESSVMDLRPTIEMKNLQERKSIPSSLAWYPKKPHDLLLVGCWDGKVAVFKHHREEMCLLSCFSADIHPIRSVSWVNDSDSAAMKTDEDDSSPSSSEIYDEKRALLYATAGHGGSLKIWSVHQPEVLLMQKVLSYYRHIMDVKFCREPSGFVAVLDDGNIYFLRSTCDGFNLQGSQFKKNCFFSINMHEDGFVAMSAVTGDVLLFHSASCLKYSKTNSICRNRELLSCISSMSVDDNGVISLEGIGSKPKERSVNPPQQLHVYRSAWMPSIPQWENMFGIAYGCGSGILRFQTFDRVKTGLHMKVRL